MYVYIKITRQYIILYICSIFYIFITKLNFLCLYSTIYTGEESFDFFVFKVTKSRFEVVIVIL